MVYEGHYEEPKPSIYKLAMKKIELLFSTWDHHHSDKEPVSTICHFLHHQFDIKTSTDEHDPREPGGEAISMYLAAYEKQLFTMIILPRCHLTPIQIHL